MSRPFCKGFFMALAILQTLPAPTIETGVRLRGDGIELPDLNIAFKFEIPTPAAQPAREITLAPVVHPAGEATPSFSWLSSELTSSGPDAEIGTRESIRRPGSGDLKRKRKTKSFRSNKTPMASTDEGPLEDTRPPEKLQEPVRLPETHAEVYKHDRTGEASAVIQPPLNVHDWQMARGNEELKEGLENGQPVSQTSEELVKLFKALGFQESDGFYWLPPHKLATIPLLYREIRKSPRSLAKTFKVKFGPLQVKIAEQILLTLANQKLNLDVHPIFKKLMSWTLSTTDKKLKELEKFRVRSDRMKTIRSYVSQTTKIATFWIILRLSLFNQHPQGGLRKEMVGGILDYIKGVWEKLERQDKKLLHCNTWAENSSAILRLEIEHESTANRYLYARGNVYRVALKIAESWEAENWTYDSYKFKPCIRTMILDIIFHSNPNLLARLLEEEGKKQRGVQK